MSSLRFYRTRGGREPFVDWFESLKDTKGTALINNRIRRLVLGQRGDHKHVGKAIFELRVYFAEHGADIVLLVLAGRKGTQKRDIKQAVAYWEDYKEQYNE